MQPSRGGTSDALLLRSDASLYGAKQRGRNRVHCLTADVAA
jgi:PleD family two-component response regulator